MLNLFEDENEKKQKKQKSKETIAVFLNVEV